MRKVHPWKGSRFSAKKNKNVKCQPTAMAVNPENDHPLHRAIEEENEGEIQLLTEKYECILGSVEVKGRRGEYKGRFPCFPRV